MNGMMQIKKKLGVEHQDVNVHVLNIYQDKEVGHLPVLANIPHGIMKKVKILENVKNVIASVFKLHILVNVEENGINMIQQQILNQKEMNKVRVLIQKLLNNDYSRKKFKDVVNVLDVKI